MTGSRPLDISGYLCILPSICLAQIDLIDIGSLTPTPYITTVPIRIAKESTIQQQQTGSRHQEWYQSPLAYKVYRLPLQESS